MFYHQLAIDNVIMISYYSYNLGQKRAQYNEKTSISSRLFSIWSIRADLNRRISELQSLALPLGYGCAGHIIENSRALFNSIFYTCLYFKP